MAFGRSMLEVLLRKLGEDVQTFGLEQEHIYFFKQMGLEKIAS